MRKRMLSAAMAGMMVVSMTACGGSKPAETTAAATEAETSAEESTAEETIAEAAKLLGYSRSQTFFRIILPQVIKRILPSVTNEVITLVKDTSLAFTISVLEMFSIAKALASSQTSMIPFVAAGLFYYIFNLVVAVVMEWIEKKLSYYE